MNPFSGLNPGGWGVPTDTGGFVNIIKTIFTVVFSLAGVGAVGYIVWGGYKIIMSTGDPQKLKEGQDTIMYATMGLVIILTSVVLFNFVAEKLGVGGLTVLNLPTQ